MADLQSNAIPQHECGTAYQHCLDALIYRSIVFVKLDGNKRPLYLVAGSADPAVGFKKALERAFKMHGGTCFYCAKAITEMTVDHVEPVARGGSDALQNLVISCKPCNSKKGPIAIEAFNPRAGKAWLTALLTQVRSRLNDA